MFGPCCDYVYEQMVPVHEFVFLYSLMHMHPFLQSKQASLFIVLSFLSCVILLTLVFQAMLKVSLLSR